MPYTNVAKPTGVPYSNVNKAFNDISLYGTAIYGLSKYGAINNYSNISKPSAGGYTNVSKPT